MRYILVAVFLLDSTEAYSAKDSTGRDRVWDNCVQQTKIRTKVSWKQNTAAANACYRAETERLEEKRLNDAYVNRENAEADWYRDNTRLKNRNKTK